MDIIGVYNKQSPHDCTIFIYDSHLLIIWFFYTFFVNNREIMSRYKYRLCNVQVKKKEKTNSITLLATIESIYRKNNILLLEICETPILLHSKTTREIKTK